MKNSNKNNSNSEMMLNSEHAAECLHDHSGEHCESSTHDHSHDHHHGHDHSHCESAVCSKAAQGDHSHPHTNSHAEGSSHRNIFIAFMLNLTFVIIELIGGLLTNSFAILSDAVHDAGDCLAIGCAWLLEKKSKKAPQGSYTYGYRRYSVISALITALVLVAGSVLVISSAVERILAPEEINAKGMLIISVAGIVFNGIAVFKTHSGSGVNERVISLHMLEDVLGWAVVLVGSVCIWLFDLPVIDPILSVGVALFVLWHAVRNVLEVMSVLLEKAPAEFSENELRERLSDDERILGIHHVHVWTLDGENMLATMHAVVPDGLSAEDTRAIKECIRHECAEMGIGHVTIELDAEGELCADCDCRVHELSTADGGHHHHHHH